MFSLILLHYAVEKWNLHNKHTFIHIIQYIYIHTRHYDTVCTYTGADSEKNFGRG
jgi:hypothetical protein